MHLLNVAFLILAALSASAVGGERCQKQYLTEEGELTEQLIYRDSQAGFAGVTGYLWTIEPDGSWKRQTFLNDLVRDADRSGKLRPGQLQELAEALKQNDLLGLPEQQGEEPQVNPKFITLQYGDKEFRYALIGGGELPEVDPDHPRPTNADRFVNIVNVILDLLEADSEDAPRGQTPSASCGRRSRRHELRSVLLQRT